MSLDVIFELEDSEAEWWEGAIKEHRSRLVKDPHFYVTEALKSQKIDKTVLASDFDRIFGVVRESAWQLYLKDEAAFHTEVLSHLIKSRSIPREILSTIVQDKILKDGHSALSAEDLTLKVAETVGEYAGRVMPYIYTLSLSTTNSRRSRAGTTFEAIIEICMTTFDIPYKNQSSLGTTFYQQHGIGKKVDLIVPGAEEYAKNRAKCAIVTMKTTLRERWQEVAEELSRTNVPHIYLLTLDKSVTEGVIKTIKNYNITLVVPSLEKDKFADHTNVMDFSTFFNKEMPHIAGYWVK